MNVVVVVLVVSQLTARIVHQSEAPGVAQNFVPWS
jgi:hypothetical protein